MERVIVQCAEALRSLLGASDLKQKHPILYFRTRDALSDLISQIKEQWK